MRTHGFNPSEEDLRDMIRNVDKNSNGAIDFNEFIEMMLKQGVNADEDAAHAFKVFDRDGDGLITAEELRWQDLLDNYFSIIKLSNIQADHEQSWRAAYWSRIVGNDCRSWCRRRRKDKFRRVQNVNGK